MKKENLIQIGVRVTKEQHAWIKKQAKKKDLGEAEFVRSMIDYIMEESK